MQNAIFINFSIAALALFSASFLAISIFKNMKKIKNARCVASCSVKIFALIFFSFIALVQISALHNDFRMKAFLRSVLELPLPADTRTLSQKHWFGGLWACGDHADFLVAMLIESRLNAEQILKFYEKIDGIEYPTGLTKQSEFYGAKVFMFDGNGWHSVERSSEKGLIVESVDISAVGMFGRYISEIASGAESIREHNAFMLVFLDQDYAGFDLRAH